VIESELPLGEALISAIENHVTIMPWQGPGGRLTSDRVADRARDCFRLLGEHYDLLILDAPPLPGPRAVAEMGALTALAAPCDVYLVRDVRTMSVTQVEDACRRLQAASLDVAGVIENFSVQDDE
jgi:hypothetical protein